MRFLILFLCVWALAACAQTSPRAAADRHRVASIVDPLIEADMRMSGIPGAAFVFVRDGRIIYARGYGLADVASRTPVVADRTIWPIASITKTLTAVASLQLVEQKRLQLDGDVNRSLRRLRVAEQGFGPLTLRHLLSHTAALDELPGRRTDGERSIDLASFLRDRLRRYRAPGLRTAYSTYGVAVAGVLVEDVSGQSYASYLQRHIFAPARMRSARIMATRAESAGVATPYAIHEGRASAIDHEYYVTTPTSSAVATATDIGRYVAALLGDGLLSSRMRRSMFADQATLHPGLPGWGLGFQLDRVNGERIAEHGGDIAGFASLLSLLPERGEGFFIVHHGEGGGLRYRVKQALLDGLYPAPAPAVPAADPANAARLAEYSGRYFSTIACRSCPFDEDNVFELGVNPDGSLSLWGQRWLPVGSDLFIREDGRRKLGFSRDPSGRVDGVSGGSFRVADKLP